MPLSHTNPVREYDLKVPTASLYYELRGSGPLLALVGCPMGAGPFGPVAELLARDHLVLTADPRGIGRSRLDDPDSGAPPELRADDLARLLTHLDAGPAVVVGSSGGAVTALALAQAHPALAHTIVAHEPPLDVLLDDHERHRVETERMIATYLDGDIVGAWKRFFDQAKLDVPHDAIEQMFGGERDPQDVADERYFFSRVLLPTTTWQPDVARLRSVATRIVVGIGEASAGQLCDATSSALAAELGVPPVAFPGGHAGFSDEPHEFAERLRSVLGGTGHEPAEIWEEDR
jgi:pimeloyl-ACP methyl ester carboxylesterase